MEPRVEVAQLYNRALLLWRLARPSFRLANTLALMPMMPGSDAGMMATQP